MTLYIIHVFTFDYKKTFIFVDETVIQKYMYNITYYLSMYQLKIPVVFKTICNKKLYGRYELQSISCWNHWFCFSIHFMHCAKYPSTVKLDHLVPNNSDTVKSKIQVNNVLWGLNLQKILKLKKINTMYELLGQQYLFTAFDL